MGTWELLRSRTRWPVVTLIALVAVFVGGAQAAPNQPTWSPPITVPGSVGSDQEHAAAVDASGDVLAAWTRSVGNGDDVRVQVALRRSGQAFGPPVTLSTPGLIADNVAVAFDRFGNAIAAWNEQTGSDAVRIAIRARDGRFGKPVTISGAGNADTPTVAFDGAGDAFVLWSVNGHAGHGVQLAIRPHGGHFQAPVTLSAGAGGSGAPRLAVDARGDALLLWRQCNNDGFDCDGGRQLLEAAWRPAGGSVGRPVVVSGSTHYPENPEVAIGGTGQAVVVWMRGDTAQFSAASVGGTFSAPATLATEASNPQIAIDGAGNAIAAWVADDPALVNDPAAANEDQRVQAAVLLAGAPAFDAPQNVTGDGAPAFPVLAMNPRGDAVLAWEKCSTIYPTCPHTLAQAATRTPGQPFGVPTTVSPLNQDVASPTTTLSPTGEAVTVWDDDIKDVIRVGLATYRIGG